MASPNWLKKLSALGRTLLPWLIIFGIIGAILAFQSALWPNGFGIQESKSVTTTVEKNDQGKIIKTVETTKTDPGKTLWDWLSLLGVPITLAILGYWLQQIQQKRAEEVAKEQRELSADETKEEVLQVYFDRLSVLLVDKNLLAIAAKVNSKEAGAAQASQEEKEILASAVDVIRARTLSILRRFEKDIERKNSVIRFLIEADFISKLNLSLSGANLSGANLSFANLSFAKLIRANLSGADLSRAFLSNANLIRAKLNGAKLSETIITNAQIDLKWKLVHELQNDGGVGRNLSDAELSGAYLSNAELKEANLSNADLSGAKLIGAKLNRANLSGAELSGAELSGAELTGIKIYSSDQIKSTKNWESALYDGKRLDTPEVRKQLGLDTQPKP